jgi:apolipoprotein N-acyltransferase
LTRARRLGLAALSGLLLGLAFPKPGLAPLAFVALTPLLLGLNRASRRMGFLCGQVTGAIQGLIMLSWVFDVLSRYGGIAGPVAGALTFLLALAYGLFIGAFGALQAHLARSFAAKSLLLAPFAFVTCEFLRAHLLFGFPWCLLGYSQVEFSELIQISSFTAVHGVSFLLAATSAGLAQAVSADSSFERRIGITLPALLVSGAMAYGHGRLQQPLPGEGSLPVGVIQASIPQDQKWDSALLQSNIEAHEELSRVAVDGGARLVVWPESAVGYEIDLYPETRKEIGEFTAKEAVYLLTGNDDRDRDASGRVRSYVGAKLISPGGEIALRYHKMRLVPFGEYLPLPSWVTSFLPVKRLVAGVSDFTPGTKAVTGEVRDISLGAFICYEAIFPSLVREFPLAGAQVLFNLTNDGWYGTSAAPYQHYAMARFRAVENHRFLVRAANTGISAIIDPFGRELARSELMERRALVGEVRAISELTFYTRHGDVFAWSLTATAALACLFAAFRDGVGSNKLSASPGSGAASNQETH